MVGVVLVVIGWLVSMLAMSALFGRSDVDARNETSLAKFTASQHK